MVIVTPGATLLPDAGVIVAIPQVTATVDGMPLATAGSICAMINTVTGIPYPLVIGPLASLGVLADAAGLVRVGDMIPSPPGVLAILGPPAAPFILDGNPP